jgi:hypothetical protein
LSEGGPKGLFSRHILEGQNWACFPAKNRLVFPRDLQVFPCGAMVFNGFPTVLEGVEMTVIPRMPTDGYPAPGTVFPPAPGYPAVYVRRLPAPRRGVPPSVVVLRVLLAAIGVCMGAVGLGMALVSVAVLVRLVGNLF